MTHFPTGRLWHSPWDFDPEWFPGTEFPPAPRDLPEETPVLTPDEEPLEPPAYDSARSPLIRPAMKILLCAHAAIMRHLASVEPEAGGMLLGPKGSPVVTHYVQDEHGHATAASFTIDAVGLNRILRKFLDCGMDAKGLVHSHPRGCTGPSGGDLAYVRRSFCNKNNKDVAEFLLPIVCDGEFYPYIVTAGDRVLLADLLLV